MPTAPVFPRPHHTPTKPNPGGGAWAPADFKSPRVILKPREWEAPGMREWKAKGGLAWGWAVMEAVTAEVRTGTEREVRRGC